MKHDPEILRAARIGYTAERARIDAAIAEIDDELGKSAGRAVLNPVKPARKTRVLTVAARRRIAAAQKKRWAEHRRQQAAKAS